MTSLLFFFFVFLNSRVFSWNFSNVGMTQDVLIWRFTIWRNKAYLAIPRWNKRSVKQPFTLLEAPWPEVSGIPLQFGITIPELVPYPDNKSQDENKCQNLQSITGLDSDSRGRLFVLDAPTTNNVCKTAKIIVFDLRRNEKIIETELKGISPRNLKCLKIDPLIAGQAYVTDPGDDSLIIYSLAEKNWRQIKLSSEFDALSKTVITDLAISRKNSVLYLTGYPSHDLFSIDLENIRYNNSGFFVSSTTIAVPTYDSVIGRTNVSWVGYKMGSSSGLMSDLREGLHYFMVTETASVRWDTREKLEAKNHAIVLQSEIVPSITDYSFDSQKNVWAIVNEKYPFSKGAKINKNRSIVAKRRTVKIYKHNPFIF